MKYKIVLDAGHGGADAGAVNKNHKLKESDMALDVVLRARRLLNQVMLFHVILTRSTDKFLTISPLIFLMLTIILLFSLSTIITP